MNDSHLMLSKEPRPVYSREMDILGFDKRWKYKKQDDAPYMWAESNAYYYRGEQVAKTNGGSLYELPTVEYLVDESGEAVLPEGKRLKPVDIETMVEKNRVIMNVLEQTTVQKIFDVYKRYRKRLDCFHVAFSGGKDSIVLLDLVKKALPHGSFVVVFGDTGMEFPDTYNVIDQVEKQCEADEIKFYRASSHLKPEESWKLFGPPSRVLRWCCSVHKSAPQVLKLREILEKSDYRGMAFVGVRSQESANRADYEYENEGGKQQGQFSFNPLLEWTSVEVWLYMYMRNLCINKAYFSGNGRIGCVFCPMSLKTDYFKRISYPETIGKFVSIVETHFTPANIENGYWCARKDGSLLKDHSEKYKEYLLDNWYYIEIDNPTTDWSVWIITMGNIPFPYFIEEQTNNYLKVKFDKRYLKIFPKETGLFRKTFHKAAFCVQCGVCVTNCRRGCISFVNNQVHIENCIHCQECNKLDGGCLAYRSLKLPQYGDSVMDKPQTIDKYNSHGPKQEWLDDFFSQREEFLENNSLGPDQNSRFKVFLRDANLLSGKQLTDFSKLYLSLNWESDTGLGLLLVNLANNSSQIKWYIQNFVTDTVYTRTDVSSMLIAQGYEKKSKAITNIISAFGRICSTSLGVLLKFGTVTEKGNHIETLCRTKCNISDARVILYGLYKFSEACEGYYQFSLSRLMDFNVDSAGISPAQIFGIDRDEMEGFLNGLSAAYPEFINATFTHDLDKISLREDKTSQDVLELFNN